MQFTKSALLSIVAASQFALGAYVPSEPWTTLTPTASYLSGAITDYPSTFGIAVSKVATATSSAADLKKRDFLVRRAVTQISDGQVQATTATAKSKASSKTTKAAATQITDGQVQATTGTAKTTKAAASQIGDGQVQATTGTAKTTKAAVSQIGDGQVQATTGTAKTTEAAVSQIGDGQIQATTGTAKTTEAAVSQIGDGQIQATTGTAKTTKAAASQISDGQIQATTGSATTESGATQISDGQIQVATAASSEEEDGQITDVDGDDVSDPVTAVSCYSDDTLAMTLNNSILLDASGRVGSIVANRQFQFDGPPPQAGAIYAAGWSITEDGLLAIGNSSTFYECLSGTFYNLYDEDIGSECYEIVLQIVDLTDC